MAPVRSVRAVGVGVGVGTRWRRDNRPDFPGVVVWVDAVAEIEIDAEAFGFGGESDRDEGFGAVGDSERRGGRDARAGGGLQDPDEAGSVPRTVDAWSPEYGKVWRPLSGSGREPRPGLLLSVVRAGAVVACPAPLPDPPTGALARALARLERMEPSALKVLPVEHAPPRPQRPKPPKTYADVRALVGILAEILAGRRAATHAAAFTDPEVRGKLRKPHYPRTAALKSVRLVESGAGVEATALLQDRGRTRVVALRFDRADDSRWCCTALQTG